VLKSLRRRTLAWTYSCLVWRRITKIALQLPSVINRIRVWASVITNVETRWNIYSVTLVSYFTLFLQPKLPPRFSLSITTHKRRSSVNFGGGARHFCPKIYEKITKCPNFRWYLPEKYFYRFFWVGAATWQLPLCPWPTSPTPICMQPLGYSRYVKPPTTQAVVWVYDISSWTKFSRYVGENNARGVIRLDWSQSKVFLVISVSVLALGEWSYYCNVADA